MDEWTHKWLVDKWINGHISGLIDKWMNGHINGLVDKWMNKWMDGWTNGPDIPL